jgi:hypothetical protein
MVWKMSESTNKREFIKILSNGKKLVNHHEEDSKNLVYPLLYSEDKKARDMLLLPVSTKLPRGMLDFYKDVL